MSAFAEDDARLAGMHGYEAVPPRHCSTCGWELAREGHEPFHKAWVKYRAEAAKEVTPDA